MLLQFGNVHVITSFCSLMSGAGEDVDVNSLAFIGKLTGYDSEEYQLSKYYITGARVFVDVSYCVNTNQKLHDLITCGIHGD